jgi:hypothetical protein
LALLEEAVATSQPYEGIGGREDVTKETVECHSGDAQLRLIRRSLSMESDILRGVVVVGARELRKAAPLGEVEHGLGQSTVELDVEHFFEYAEVTGVPKAITQQNTALKVDDQVVPVGRHDCEEVVTRRPGHSAHRDGVPLSDPLLAMRLKPRFRG